MKYYCRTTDTRNESRADRREEKTGRSGIVAGGGGRRNMFTRRRKKTRFEIIHRSTQKYFRVTSRTKKLSRTKNNKKKLEVIQKIRGDAKIWKRQN